MNFKDQILARTGTPETASTNSEITYYLNSTIKDVINKIKAVNPDGYSRLGVETEVASEGTTIIDGDIVGVYGTSVHEGAAITALTITVSGSGYTYEAGIPSTTITVTITGGGGSGAAGYAVVGAGGALSDLVLTNGGSGYTSTPTMAITTTDSGVNGEGITVLNAASTYRRPATELSYELSEQAKNPNSIHYQSKFNPVWVRKGRSISILPDGGMILHIDIPVTTYDSTDIGSLPKNFENAVVIGSSIRHTERYLQYLTSNLIPEYAEATIPAPPSFVEVLPADIIAPTFTWVGTALASKFDGQSIDTTNITNNFPSYVAPTLEAVSLTEINDLDLPDPPAIPGFITQSVEMSDIPTFSAPALQVEPFPTIADFSITAVLPSPPLAPSLTAESASSTSVTALPGPPVYVAPKILGQAKSMLEDALGSTIAPGEADAQNINTLLEAAWSYVVEEEDMELANGTLAVVSQIQNLYSAAMSESDKHYQQQVTEYNAEIANQMEQTRLDQAQAQKQDDFNWQAQMAQYEKELGQHSAEMARYQASVTTEQSEWQLQNLTYKVATWNNKQDKYFSEFDKSMQVSMNEFQNSMLRWDKEFQEKTKNLEYSGQAQASQMAMFDKEFANYNTNVKSTTDEYQQNEILKKWEIYKFDYTQSLSKFSADMQSNLNIFNEQNTKLTTYMQIAQANAGNVQSALMNQMQADTELAKNNEAQRVAMELQTFQQELATFNGNLTKYTSEVSTLASRYNVEMTASTNQMNLNQQIYQAEFAEFQNKQQTLEKLLGSLRQEYAESVGIATQQKQGS